MRIPSWSKSISKVKKSGWRRLTSSKDGMLWAWNTLHHIKRIEQGCINSSINQTESNTCIPNSRHSTASEFSHALINQAWKLKCHFVLCAHKNGGLSQMESILDMKMRYSMEKEFLKNLIACGSWTFTRIRMRFARMNSSRHQRFQLTSMQSVLGHIRSLKTMIQCILHKEFLWENLWLRIWDMNWFLESLRQRLISTNKISVKDIHSQRWTM